MDIRTIGLICIIGGGILFIRQIIRLVRGKSTKCDCGNLFPRENGDKDSESEDAKGE